MFDEILKISTDIDSMIPAYLKKLSSQKIYNLQAPSSF